MKAGRFAFILHHAAAAAVKIIYHLGQKILQVTLRIDLLAVDGIKTGICDIERGAILMG